jgi:hypothetical protein
MRMLTIHPHTRRSEISPFMVREMHVRVYGVQPEDALRFFAATLEMLSRLFFSRRLPAALLFNKQAREPVARQSAFLFAPPTSDGMQLFIYTFFAWKKMTG